MYSKGLTPRVRLTVGYYLATPLFALLDFVWGVNVRAAGLEALRGPRYAYYALCLICGVVTYLAPSLTNIIGVAESSVNILVLMLGIIVPYYGMAEQVMSDRPVSNPVTAEHVVNFLISGFVWVSVFYRSSLPSRTG